MPDLRRESGTTKLPGVSQTRPAEAVTEIAEALNRVVADAFSLFLKTKNFHWHVSGPHFRDYHLLFEEQATQIFAIVDPIAERVRKIGGSTIRSINHIAKLRQINDNDASFVSANEMLQELMDDNRALIAALRAAHDLADEYEDLATEGLLETYIDEAEERVWFLSETSGTDAQSGHAH